MNSPYNGNLPGNNRFHVVGEITRIYSNWAMHFHRILSSQLEGIMTAFISASQTFTSKPNARLSSRTKRSASIDYT